MKVRLFLMLAETVPYWGQRGRKNEDLRPQKRQGRVFWLSIMKVASRRDFGYTVPSENYNTEAGQCSVQQIGDKSKSGAGWGVGCIAWRW
jgi:hypothetical protein